MRKKLPCIILAGGMGSRLGDITKDTPKCLIDINGLTLIQHVMENLEVSTYCSRIVVAAGYLGDKVEEYFRSYWSFIPTGAITEKSPLGTGGAIYNAMNTLNIPECVVINGDTVLKAPHDELVSMYTYLTHSNEMLELCVTHVDDAAGFGLVDYRPLTGRVDGFVEKPTGDHSGYVSAGIYKVRREIFSEDDSIMSLLDSSHPVSFERDVIPRYCTRAFELESANFIDVGTPEMLEKARKVLTGRPSC